MKIENKEFWENVDVIQTQDSLVKVTSDYEEYLYAKVKSHFKGDETKINALVFGCGTGREIPAIFDKIGANSIIATDISENMIKKCNQNLVEWNLQDKVETQVVSAVDYKATTGSFQVITLMNNMLNYVYQKKERNQIFKNCHEILADNACIIGVVHNQLGTPQKTLYFMMRRLLKLFLKNEVGFRMTGFKGFKVNGYYFSRKTLYNHLVENNFKKIEIISLSEFYKSKNVKYNKLKGYNNLLFFATKN